MKVKEMLPDSPSDVQPPITSRYISNPFALFGPAFEAFRVNFLSYIRGIAACIGILIVAALATIAIFFASHAAGVLVGVFLGIVLIYGSIRYVSPATIRFYLAMARHEKLSLREALSFPASDAWRLLGVQVLAGLLTSLPVLIALLINVIITIVLVSKGVTKLDHAPYTATIVAIIIGSLVALVGIIGSVILGVRYVCSPYVAINERIGGMAALKTSRELARGRFWEVLGAETVPQILTLLNIIPIAGSLASSVITLFIAPLFAIRYLQLSELKAAGQSATVPVSRWNYLGIVFALIATIVIGGINGYDSIKQYNATLNSQKHSSADNITTLLRKA